MNATRKLQLAERLAEVLQQVDDEFSTAKRNTVQEAPTGTVVEISIPTRKAVKDALLAWKWFPQTPPVSEFQKQAEAAGESGVAP